MAEVCGRRIDLGELERAFEDVFRVEVEDTFSATIGDSQSITLYAGPYELSLRCSQEMGGCDLMLRWEDRPSVYCGYKCDVDAATGDRERSREHLELIEKIMRVLGIPLLGSCS